MTTVTQTQLPEGIDEAIAEVEEQLSLVFGRARQIWKDAAAKIHPDLQPVGYKVLATVVRLGSTNAQAIATVLEVDKSVVSRQVRILEEHDLVVSRADDNDGRARVLSPTPGAVERVLAVRNVQQTRLRELLRSRPEEELRGFAAILHLLNEGLSGSSK